MNYYAIHFFDGSSKPISEKQREQVQQQLAKGAELITVGKEMINVKNIARVGTHSTTGEMKRLSKQNALGNLMIENPEEHKKFREKEKQRAINIALKNKQEEMRELLPEREVAELDGPDYYLSEDGEKMYS